MKEVAQVTLFLLVVAALGFIVGVQYERMSVREAVLRETKTQEKVDEKVMDLDDAGLCAALGGRLQPDGKCQRRM